MPGSPVAKAPADAVAAGRPAGEHSLAGDGAGDSPLVSAAWLAGILDIADDAIITVDQAQRIRLFNQGAEKIFGYAAREVLGQPLDLLLPARFSASHRRHVAAFGQASDHARRMGERQDIYGVRKDGTEFPAEASISRLEIGGETTYTAILRDITERKRFEQTLQEQNRELERALRAKDRFLATMSHELRTPLNAIIGFTGTLLMRLPGPLTADQEHQLQTVQSSAKHLLSLINDLLDLAKIQSGKVQLTLEPVVCQEVLAEVAAQLRPMAERKGLRLELRAPEQALILRTDRRALGQIVTNLVSNAIKFTGAGEVRVELDRRLPTAAHPDADFVVGRRSAVVVRVVDTGPGIPPEELPELFSAFAQGQAAKQAGASSGLGLHLSQELAGLLGGRIVVRSEGGWGSEFALLLPE